MCPSSDSITWFWPPPPAGSTPGGDMVQWVAFNYILFLWHCMTEWSEKSGEKQYYSLPCYTVTSWMLSLGTMLMECLDNFVIYLDGKTTSWISLILFPALLYCHLLNVELRHSVNGVPRQFCNSLDGDNHVLDLSNTIPCLAVLSPLGCWA